jgi:prepilin-type N-terminal cleavage/methylation domain-containing protein
MVDIRKNKFAFTLAEVLLTLLIIGVISSIVIPEIIQDSQNAELKIAGKRAYSALSDAARMVRVDRGGSIAPGFTSSEDFKNIFISYLNISKSCPAGQHLGNCWNSVGAYCKDTGDCDSNGIFESPGWWSGPDHSGVVLNNGSCVLFAWYSPYHTNCSGTDGPGICGRIFVDINCEKKPNTINKDVFAFTLDQNAKIGPLWNSTGFLNFLK